MSGCEPDEDWPEPQGHPWLPAAPAVSSNLTTFSEPSVEFVTVADLKRLESWEASVRRVHEERGWSIGFAP